MVIRRKTDTYYYFLVNTYYYLYISQTIYAELAFPEQIKKYRNSYRKLNKGLCIFNEINVHDMHGRAVHFKV